jgi:RNA polymerase sigma-70 factor (ECF subfamily)
MLSLSPSERKFIDVQATRTPGTVPILHCPRGELGESWFDPNMPAEDPQQPPFLPMSQTPPADLGIERFRDYLCLLARAHWHPRHYCRLDPSDVAQQTLLDAHQKQAQFRGGSDAELAQWLRQILIHNASDALRSLGAAKRNVHREQSLEATMDAALQQVQHFLAADEPSPSEAAAQIEELLALARALERLPPRQRDAIVLHHLQGMTVAELANHLQCTQGAAGALLHRALKQLRMLMSAGD